MRYRGIIFDLDGTLLDTLEDLADAANATLSEHGLPLHPLAAYRYFVGDGLRTLMERIVPEEERNPASITSLMESFRHHYSACWREKSRPYPGVAAMLTGLRDRGLLMAVLSNKPHDFTGVCVRQLLPDHSFNPVLGVRDGGPKKPDPAGALSIAGEWGIAPAHLLYLGDTATDMRTASRAGIYALGATWGFRTPEELRDNGAATLVASPEQVLEQVDLLNAFS